MSTTEPENDLQIRSKSSKKKKNSESLKIRTHFDQLGLPSANCGGSSRIPIYREAAFKFFS
jgi:hypothetical protein